jgi:hypothetical protein
VAGLPALVAVVPVLAMLVQQLGNVGDDGLPPADWAVLELATRNALAGRQLVGAYSRWGFDHPGPAMFYWMAPAYRATGERFSGLTIGTLAMNAVCLGAVVTVVRQAFGRRAAWVVAAVVAIFAWRFGLERFRDPWNPYWVIGPLAVLLVCAIACWTKPRRWPLAVAVGSASVAVQSHLGAAAVAALALTVALAGTLWLHRHAGRGWRRWILALVPAALVGGLMWMPVVVQEVRGEPGNLTELYSYARGGEEAHSLAEVGPIVVAGLAWAPASLGKAFGPDSPFVAPIRAHTGEYLLVAATGLTLAAGAVAAARRRWGIPWVLAGALPLAAAAVETVASLTIRDRVLPYLFTPVLAVALLWWLGSGLYLARAAARLVPEGWEQRIGPVVAVAAVAAALVASGSQFREGGHPAGERWERPETRAMVEQARAYCDDDRPVWIDGADTWVVSVPLGVALARCGVDVSFTGEMAYMVGDNYASTTPPRGAIRLCVKPDGQLRCTP